MSTVVTISLWAFSVKFCKNNHRKVSMNYEDKLSTYKVSIIRLNANLRNIDIGGTRANLSRPIALLANQGHLTSEDGRLGLLVLKLDTTLRDMSTEDLLSLGVGESTLDIFRRVLRHVADEALQFALHSIQDVGNRSLLDRSVILEALTAFNLLHRHAILIGAGGSLARWR